MEALALNFFLSADIYDHGAAIIKLQQHSVSEFSFLPFNSVIDTIFAQENN